MRITYIHQHFKHPGQAGGTRSWEFSSRMASAGHVVTVIAGGADPELPLPPGLAVLYVPTAYSNSMTLSARLRSFASFMMRSTTLAVRQPADIIFATSTPLTVAVPARLAALVRRVPFVFEVRDVWPSVPIALGLLTHPVLIRLAEHLERWAYAGARHIIALSPGMMEDILRTAPSAPVTVIPNGSDIRAFARTETQAAAARSERGWVRPTVIYAGSLGASYDPIWLVRLAAELQSRGVDLFIYGEGAMLEASRDLAAELGLDALRTLPGSVAKQDVIDGIVAADACISSLLSNPALEVNSLNKVFDACAARKPVFFNHGGWLTEMCEERQAGWRISRDPAQAAAFIESTLGDATEMSVRSRNALDLALGIFNRDMHYDMLMEILEDQQAK